MTLCHMLDVSYGPDGDQQLRLKLQNGADANERDSSGEAAIHVAARRRRPNAINILLEYGAEINALNAHGKTAYAHAIRRGFGETADLLREHGADTDLNSADRLAVLLTSGKLDEAAGLIAREPGIVRTGNPEEDRLLADLAGRDAAAAAVEMLLKAGANPDAPGLDGGTPLHQTAWFGQPGNARRLLNAGAKLDDFNNAHNGSALGWAAHGSRFSGDAAARSDAYVELVQLLLAAGASVAYPGREGDDAYLKVLHQDASEAVRAVLPPID